MPTLPLGPLKILYIEDDANSRRLVERLLQAEGYDVYLADDGLASLELARQIRPALVLTDGAFHATSRTGVRSGGLSLAVTHGIVRAHGGRIWVDSEGQDVERLPGSRFHVMLPMNASVLREAALANKQ